MTDTLIPLPVVDETTDSRCDRLITGSAVVLDDVKPESLTRVFALFCYGRSGSNFMAALLDSHPQIFNTPSTQISAFYDFWREYGDRPAVEQLGAFLALYEAMYKVHQLGNVPMTHYAGPLGGEESQVDAELFEDTFLALASRAVSDPHRESIPRPYFIQLLHAAYAVAMHRDMNWDDNVILLHLHAPLTSNAEPLLEDFPDAQLMHMVRRPAAVLGSLYDVWFRVGAEGDRLAGAGIEHAFGHAQPILPLATDQTRAVRIEDLNEAPRETLERVCRWMGISWNDSLLEPTFNGVPFRQQSTQGQRISCFVGQQKEARNKRTCSRVDWIRLKFLLAPVYLAWGYPLGRIYESQLLRRLSRFLWFIPFRMEKLILKRGWHAFTFETFGRFLDYCVAMRRTASERLLKGGSTQIGSIELLSSDDSIQK